MNLTDKYADALTLKNREKFFGEFENFWQYLRVRGVSRKK
jgi:hypothetical protein